MWACRSKGRVTTQREKTDSLQASERGLRKTKLLKTLILTPASRIMTNKFLFLSRLVLNFCYGSHSKLIQIFLEHLVAITCNTILASAFLEEGLVVILTYWCVQGFYSCIFGTCYIFSRNPSISTRFKNF